MNKRVSVIMSVYNGEKYIREAIDSILSQTYSDWEMIICDDASTDGTRKILTEYVERYPERFIILNNETNMRLSYSLNRCLTVCSGEYIARMDGDDISNPDRFEKQVDFLNQHPEYAVVGTAMQRFSENEKYGIVRLEQEPTKKELMIGVPFCHATIMMRKNAYTAVNGYRVSEMTKRSQDYDMWFRFFACGLRGYNLQEVLYYVREDIHAIKRRSFQNRYNIAKIQYNGYKLIHAPVIYYVVPIFQLLKCLVPSALILKMRQRRKG